MRIYPLLLVLLTAFARVSPALEPPDRAVPPGSRSYARIDPALGIDNRSFDPGLVAAFRGRASGQKANYFALWGNRMPSVGRARVLVLLIDFDEYPARPGDTPEAIRARIFGAGGKFPYESLSAYYRRSSYGKLNIDGDVLGWYHAGRRADVPMTREGREALIKNALSSFKDHDFSQYDGNNDGVIDYLTVIWTGPVGEWATFWWAVAPRFYDSSFQPGGKSIGSYSWQGIVYKWDDPESDFQTRILIHETGHAMGLPDYYDYKPGVGPDGGVGYFDMMDSTRYDHNCFSKMMLGWIDPRVAAAGGEYRLKPSSEAGDCLLVLPPGKKKDPYSEFFLLENRRPSGNDADDVVGGGLVIWHVDARLNAQGTNFLYNNSDTEHKLLRIMEADGEEELETGKSKSFGFMDFYLKGRTLGASTVPSSRLYDGTDTGLGLVSRGGDSEVSFTLTLK